jgi:predicted O-methyltransferase YrrM
MQRIEPWFTEESISFIENYLYHHTNCIICEFGSGSSTKWFANRCKKLISIEHNKDYIDILPQINNLEIIYSPAIETFDDFIDNDYSLEIDKFDNYYFDIISIDGRNRVECFKHAEPKLKNDGLMILDNSERPWYVSIFDLYQTKKRYDFIQQKPDKYGFFSSGWTTTIWIK